MSVIVDNRRVVLLKSLRTNNRFYALVPVDSDFRNAEAIPEFPDDLPLGIAYPCLEDGLNDFAVIRTTFETIDAFPDDQELRQEMMAIIEDARRNLNLRLTELRDRLQQGQAHFLGTDLNEFKDSAMRLVERGTIRRQLDSMMKVDVYESVAREQVNRFGGELDPMYKFQFEDSNPEPVMRDLPARPFVVRLFDDMLEAVENDSHYEEKFVFDQRVFQKFIALMFVNYQTTEPIFYGTHRADYGVSADKDMTNTPLYQAVGIALRELVREWEEEQAALGEDGAAPAPPPARRKPAPPREPTPPREPPARKEPAPPAEPSPFDDLETLDDLFKEAEQERAVSLPSYRGTDQLLNSPLIRIAEALRMLDGVDHARAKEARQVLLNAARQLFERLQELDVISEVAPDPFTGLDK